MTPRFTALPSQVAAGEASTTAADAPHPTTVRVVIADDIIGTLGEFRAEPAPARDANGGVRLMTDGAGLISHDLARLIPAVVAGRQVAEMLRDKADEVESIDGAAVTAPAIHSTPAITSPAASAALAPLTPQVLAKGATTTTITITTTPPQVRLWLGGLLAKGTLTAAAPGALPAATIVLRRSSMVKVSASRDHRRDHSRDHTEIIAEIMAEIIAVEEWICTLLDRPDRSAR